MKLGPLPDRAPVFLKRTLPGEHADAAGAPVLASTAHVAPTRPGAWPTVVTGLASIGEAPGEEVFYVAEQPHYSRENGVAFSVTEDVAFACFSSPDIGSLAEMTEARYSVLLGGLRARGYPHVLRVWNAVPNINGYQDGLERYRAFSVGRAAAFSASGLFDAGRYPASTAIGSHGAHLVAYAIATRSLGMHFENAAQVPAHRYPEQYGPKSPLFCRAVAKVWGASATLFVSGTASITGHESRYAEDIELQVSQTLQNVHAMVDAARSGTGCDFGIRAGASLLTVYVRNGADDHAVRRSVEKHVGKQVSIQYLRADICREELLVEIEATLSV